MPVALNGDDDSYNHFNSGFKDRYAPLSTNDKKMVRFSARSFPSLVERDAAINKRFGLNSIDYYKKLETLKDHPQLGKQSRSRLSNLMSTPGPMTGGTPIMGSKQFSHGVNW
jgi:Protein of unknown function (DUF3263)